MQQEDMYIVEASLQDSRGLLKTYPAVFPTLEAANKEFNRLIASDDGWHFVRITYGDRIINQAYPNDPNNEGEHND